MNTFESVHFELVELAEGVFAANHKDGGAAIGNAGLVDLGDRVLVFDTFISPIAAVDLRRAAETVIGKPIGEVVNSHYHNDHIRGNQVFKDSEIIASQKTLRLIETEGRIDLDWDKENAAKLSAKIDGELSEISDPKQRRTLEFGRHYYRVISEGLESFEWVAPTRSYEGSLKIEGPKRSVELRSYAGGHTGDDAILILAEDNVAFLSDLLFIDNHPYLADGDPQAWIEHLKTMVNLPEKILVPGHGQVGSGEDLERLRAYIEGVVSDVETAAKNGKSLEEILEDGIPTAYESWDLPTFYRSNVNFLFERFEERRAEN